MVYAAAVSRHPLTAAAAGDVVGQLLERLGPQVDLVCAFTTADHGGLLGEIAAVVRSALAPAALLGCASSGVIGPDGDVVHRCGVALWGGQVGPVHAIHLPDVGRPVRPAAPADPSSPPGPPPPGPASGPPSPELPPPGPSRTSPSAWSTGSHTALLLADPLSVPPSTLAAWLRRRDGTTALSAEVPVVGGVVHRAPGTGPAPLLLDGTVVHRGAVAVVLGPTAGARGAVMAAEADGPATASAAETPEADCSGEATGRTVPHSGALVLCEPFAHRAPSAVPRGPVAATAGCTAGAVVVAGARHGWRADVSGVVTFGHRPSTSLDPW